MTLDQMYTRYATDPTLLDALLTRVTAHAMSIARRRKHPDPEDLAQRAAIRVWDMWRRYDPTRGSFGGWVSAITTSLLTDDMRQRQLIQPNEDEESVSNGSVHYQPRDMSILPDRLRKIAAMLTIGYSKQEIAERMGCSVRTVERTIEAHVSASRAA